MVLHNGTKRRLLGGIDGAAVCSSFLEAFVSRSFVRAFNVFVVVEYQHDSTTWFGPMNANL